MEIHTHQDAPGAFLVIVDKEVNAAILRERQRCANVARAYLADVDSRCGGLLGDLCAQRILGDARLPFAGISDWGAGAD